MIRSKLDPGQIQQMEHDEASKAKRVKLTDTEISIELDHLDGDSVTAHPATLVVSALSVDNTDSEIVPPQDVVSLTKLKVYIKVQSGTPEGTVAVMVSPTDAGDTFFLLAEMNAQDGMSTPLELLARRVKVVKGTDLGDSVIDVHLVGQS